MVKTVEEVLNQPSSHEALLNDALVSANCMYYLGICEGFKHPSMLAKKEKTDLLLRNSEVQWDKGWTELLDICTCGCRALTSCSKYSLLE